MSQSLKEALEKAGVAELARKQIAEEIERERQHLEAERQARLATQQAAEAARRERLANLQPNQRWWQNFRMSVTPFEIKIFLKVQANQWHEALDFIAQRNLNKVTTRCKTREEAVEQVRTKIVAWQSETRLVAGQEPPAGALLYWRIYE